MRMLVAQLDGYEWARMGHFVYKRENSYLIFGVQACDVQLMTSNIRHGVSDNMLMDDAMRRAWKEKTIFRFSAPAAGIHAFHSICVAMRKFYCR